MRMRDFTQDFTCFAEVYSQNEYRLPEQFEPSDVIVDVGAHIGTFALACLARGARRVLCYEPDPANFVLLAENMAPYAWAVEVHHKAVWRSDIQQKVYLYPHKEAACTAMTVVGSGDGANPSEVEAIGLDEILAAIPGGVRLLKLDCEGSEYPILYTSKSLATVREIVGEAHEKFVFPGSPFATTSAGIAVCLGDHGFAVEVVPHPRAPDVIRWFFARQT